MDYLTQTDLEARIPASFLIQALDDDGDEAIDAPVLAKVLDSASRAVDSFLGQRYQVPFAAGEVPAIASQAAILFACELLYQRRGLSTEEQNPWLVPARAMRKRLGAIASGEQPLTPSTERQQPSVSSITEPSRAQSSRGHLLT